MTDEERAAALRANVSAYSNLDEREYVNGAPHLKHDSIARIYRSLIDSALERIDRDSATVEVLDLGAGDGMASVPWFEYRVRLTAVDSSEHMLGRLTDRAAVFGVNPQTVVADALDYLQSSGSSFDIVTHVSMLHHVPDYLDLLERSSAHVRPGGCLITFQDPLRYDHMPPYHHLLERGSYFAWRTGQGNLKRGLKTRWRRLRGVYSSTEVVDFEDYHVIRGGVDSEAIVRLLQTSFSEVSTVSYWSTYSRPLQSLGERLHLASSFGILACGRKPS
jgi:2-polyprenyl-6-hydroxyphenyl methylase / 3-demethylubiquinone-9 3-methyltransferase